MKFIFNNFECGIMHQFHYSCANIFKQHLDDLFISH